MERSEKEALLGEIYIPSYPIQLKQFFSGRGPQLVKAMSIINMKGLQGIIYGDRGVGKTSFSNILKIIYQSDSCQVVKVSCNLQDTFPYLWYNILSQLSVSKETINNTIGYRPKNEVYKETIPLTELVDSNNITVVTIQRALSKISGSAVVIIDEFDRLDDEFFDKKLFTDFIKSLSDSIPHVTLLIIGVSEDVSSLIQGHESIERNLSQIYMPVMTPAEITEIVKKGEEPLDIYFTEPALEMIIKLSSGYPHFAHSLCYYSANIAISANLNKIGIDVLKMAIQETINNTQESLKNGYRIATLATKQNIFKEVLFAASMCPTDEYGYFQANDLQPLLTNLLKKEVKVNNFTFHLGKFCSDERGDILKTAGSKNRQKYKFKNPLMKAFVRLNSTNNI